MRENKYRDDYIEAITDIMQWVSNHQRSEKSEEMTATLEKPSLGKIK